MATYETLRDRALKEVGCLGQTEAEDIAEIALEQAMRFVAFRVRVPALIASATATAPASPELEANAITLGSGSPGFNILSTYQTPDRLYVKKDSSAVEIGTPYEFLEYHHFQDLKNVKSGYRNSIYEGATFDERPTHVYTITPSNKLWATPLTEGNVLTLVYRKEPAAYGDGTGSPEIASLFDHILTNGAVLALKEWEREPEGIVTMWQLFEQGLTNDIQEYDRFINAASRNRKGFKIHKSYRP